MNKAQLKQLIKEEFQKIFETRTPSILQSPKINYYITDKGIDALKQNNLSNNLTDILMWLSLNKKNTTRMDYAAKTGYSIPFFNPFFNELLNLNYIGKKETSMNEAANSPKIFNKNFGAYMNKLPGARIAPTFAVLKKETRDYFRNLDHIKLIKKGPEAKGEKYQLFISPALKSALDMLQRGRGTYTPSPSMKNPEKWSDQTDIIDLSKQVSEKIPSNVRSVLKNNTFKLNPSVNMFQVEHKVGLAKGPIIDPTKNQQIADEGDLVFPIEL